MRIDNSKGISAEEWINTASKQEIEDVFWLLGEDRSSRKIAKKICDKSKLKSDCIYKLKIKKDKLLKGNRIEIPVLPFRNK